MEPATEPTVGSGCCGPDLGRLTRARRAAARAEFVLWCEVLRFLDEARAELEATDPSPHRGATGSGCAVLDVAQTLGLSELAVEVVESVARGVRRRLPALWRAFGRGDVDAQRVRTISQVLDRAESDALVELLDGRAVDYAASHTAAELRVWLRRWHARLEPGQTTAAAASARDRRRVEVVHGDDAMSWVSAYLPTPVAVAVEHRLSSAARALPAVDPGTGECDERTLEQKRADLLGCWLTGGPGSRPDVRAEVAISIDATDLAGLTDGPGVVRGLGLPVPAAWVRELAASPTTLFRRLVLDPVGEVMDTTSLGYQPPEALRTALQWRDGLCRVAGCQVPADRTDLDHQRPWGRGGPTAADNLRSLCRRHHRMKSHGHLAARHYRPPTRYRERAPALPPVEVDLVHAA
ncbi:DUF222 domain-containing protein [Auraticoccus sp. F435]|uniref:DUF222 domain-containing protein n=1 Tax=Auraticoccus cholistanensis TaxID=2656650 RepID=A0A6A9V169_9ACTN|nr:HNH endonuclease signature motif containing protein [Auraticoccus cholistanensis]MVA76570.1 DUF222 domain-containing protein [Auraticoccus cholistanensis]